MRAFTAMWDRICRDRFGVSDPSQRRFRYGVQVNSLGLTEQQPENNVQRIVLELLGVTLSADARARAVQLPAWNEAIGLPRQADQQWSLRIQQVLAFETDLLEYPDLFAGSLVMEAKTHELMDAAQSRARRRARARRRLRRDRGAEAPAGRQPDRPGRGDRVGRAPRRRRELLHRRAGSVLGDNAAASIMTVDPAVETRARRRRRGVAGGPRRGCGRRGARGAATGRRASSPSDNMMVPTIALALAGGTTGEWAGALREVFGEYRAPTGVGSAVAPRASLVAVAVRAREAAATHGGPRGSSSPSPGSTATRTAPSRSPWPPGTRASRSSTRASGCPRQRSSRPRATRTSTSSGCPSCRARTWLSSPRSSGCSRTPGVRAVVVGGIVPAEDAAALIEARRARRLHAEGLRARRDYGRARRPEHRASARRGRRARLVSPPAGSARVWGAR